MIKDFLSSKDGGFKNQAFVSKKHVSNSHNNKTKAILQMWLKRKFLYLEKAHWRTIGLGKESVRSLIFGLEFSKDHH